MAILVCSGSHQHGVGVRTSQELTDPPAQLVDKDFDLSIGWIFITNYY
jgi:hypothetical protein